MSNLTREELMRLLEKAEPSWMRFDKTPEMVVPFGTEFSKVDWSNAAPQWTKDGYGVRGPQLIREETEIPPANTDFDVYSVQPVQPATPTTGACCFGIFCEDGYTADACEAEEGIFKGLGSSCAMPCPCGTRIFVSYTWQFTATDTEDDCSIDFFATGEHSDTICFQSDDGWESFGTQNLTDYGDPCHNDALMDATIHFDVFESFHAGPVWYLGASMASSSVTCSDDYCSVNGGSISPTEYTISHDSPEGTYTFADSGLDGSNPWSWQIDVTITLL